MLRENSGLQPKLQMRELLGIEPTAPKWRELAEIHGIFTAHNEESGTRKLMEGGAE